MGDCYKHKIEASKVDPAILAEVKQFSAGTIYIVSRPYVSAEVQVVIDGLSYNEVGFAKVSAPDAFDADLGMSLARHKALCKVARRVAAERAGSPIPPITTFIGNLVD